MSQIHQCQSCGEWRHVSMFTKGRACDQCLAAGNAYQPVRITPEEIARKQQEVALARSIMAEWIITGIMPEGVTESERKIILRGATDLVSIDVIAREMSISVKRADAIQKRAQAKMLKLARAQAEALSEAAKILTQDAAA